MTINGVSMGEFGELVLCASELGVPSILAVGCEAFCREARDLVPGIETVSVKRGLQCDPGHHLPPTAYRRHNTAAVHLSPEAARARIRAGARRAIERMRMETFGIVPTKPPYEMVAVFRSDDTMPPRVCRKRHATGVAELLNRPWEYETLRHYDPLRLLSDKHT